MIPTKEFGLDREHLGLDFLNTQPGRAGNVPRESLTDYADLLTWGLEANIISNEIADRLLAIAQQQPVEAQQSLHEARTFREALYRLITADWHKQTRSQDDLTIFNRVLASSLSHSRLVEQAGYLILGWDEQTLPLQRVLWDVAHAATELLTTSSLALVRTCANETCDWVFLDTSKNRSRRWCSMKSCGNRAKARRHHKRQKQATYDS